MANRHDAGEALTLGEEVLVKRRGLQAEFDLGRIQRVEDAGGLCRGSDVSRLDYESLDIEPGQRMPAFRGRLDLARPAERLADGIAVDRECPGQPLGLIESRYLARERAS